MKKIFIFFGICIVLIAQNIAATNNIYIDEKSYTLDNFLYKEIIKDDPPDWATGEFNGTWGISIGGLPAIELGWVEGYFDNLGIFGRIEGDFAVWQNDDPTAYMNGIIIGYYTIGIVGDYINPDNATFYIGLGAPNEDGEFYYRINLFIGPSWYMEGNWREI